VSVITCAVVSVGGGGGSGVLCAIQAPCS